MTQIGKHTEEDFYTTIQGAIAAPMKRKSLTTSRYIGVIESYLNLQSTIYHSVHIAITTAPENLTDTRYKTLRENLLGLKNSENFTITNEK